MWIPGWRASSCTSTTTSPFFALLMVLAAAWSVQPTRPPANSALISLARQLLGRPLRPLRPAPHHPRRAASGHSGPRGRQAAAAGSDDIFTSLENMLPLPQVDEISSEDILRGLGIPVERHYVYTEDGYRLLLDRVPCKACKAGRRGGQPAFLAHGLQVASSSFVLLGNNSIVSVLHEAGYDLWLVNYRGTSFSQVHVKYTVHDEEFWKFSFHELGVFDNTAAIDYVLRETGFPDLLYVGHSMGSTAFLPMAASRPEYLAKVRAAFLMGPVATLKHSRSPAVRMLYSINNATQELLDRTASYRTILPFMRLAGRMANSLCPLFPVACSFILTVLLGSRRSSDFMSLPHFWATYPSGGSYGETIHYVQNSNPNLPGFHLYDHGPARNMELYGAAVPPAYELSAITVPVYLYLGSDDILCDPRDVAFLVSQLPNVTTRLAQDDQFNHIDFITFPKVRELVYAVMARDMRRFPAQPPSS